MAFNVREAIEKLDYLEQVAYDGGCGSDYLSEIGEQIRFYLMNCENNIKEPDYEDFYNYIVNFANEFLEQ